MRYCGSDRDIKREVLKLHREITKIRADRNSLLEEIGSLHKEIREQWASFLRRRDNSIIRARNMSSSDSDERISFTTGG